MEHPSESIFLIEIEKIKPNPLQPRTDFDENKLNELAESIRQYGVLQPLVVVRQEQDSETGLLVEYELIAGERRLRAAKIAGLNQVPVIIRKEPAERVKLEMALVENVQREDLNAIERARAFEQLTREFGLKHRDIASRIGKSRESVSNTIRLLTLPDKVQKALVEGLINEGHTRPLLMLQGRPEEQQNLLQEIIAKNLNVREAERISRRIAYERARKREPSLDPTVRSIEEKLGDVLGTRVTIEKKESGGRIFIEFFSDEELNGFLKRVGAPEAEFIKKGFEPSSKEKEEASLPEEKEETISSIVGEVAKEEFSKPDASDPTLSLKVDEGFEEDLKSFTV